jgi:hypothetical protein
VGTLSETHMHNQIVKLISDLGNYREAVDQIFSGAIQKPEDCPRYFLGIQISVSQLYLDDLLLRRELDTFAGTPDEETDWKRPSIDTRREAALRERLRKQMEAWSWWDCFRLKDAFSDQTGLLTQEDYLQSFWLHLPEIYEETVRVEECAKRFLLKRSESALACVEIGMQHICRHHVSFVLPALERAADEDRWAG